MTEQIKPCPFCGGKTEIDRMCSVNETECLDYLVRCSKCGVSMLENSEEAVVSSWNTRKLLENNPLTLDEVKALKNGSIVWLETSDFIEPILIIDIQSSVIDFEFIINSHGGSHLELAELAKEYFLYCNNPKEEQMKSPESTYTPTCPRGYTDCVCDPAYIKFYHPDWYKNLYGDKTPEEASYECQELMKKDPNEEYYCYDNEDK